MSAEINLNKVGNLCVVVQKHVSCDGCGDELFAIKLFDVLRRSFSESFNVSIHPLRDFEAVHLQKIDSTLPLEPLEMVAQKAAQLPTLVFHGPDLSRKGVRDEEEPILPDVIFERAFVRHLEEYSLGKMGLAKHRSFHLKGKLCETGIGLGKWGIFTDKELFKTMSEIYKSGKTCNPELIGELIDGNLRAILDSNRDIFLGYSKQFFDQICFTYAALDTTKRDVDICIPSLLSESFVREFQRWFKDDVLVEKGICSIEILYRENKGDSFVLKIKSASANVPAGKNVRIIFCPHLDHRDILRLLAISQALTLPTRDQSFSEEISAAKIVLYDIPAHKRGLAEEARQICADSDWNEAELFFRLYSDCVPSYVAVLEDPARRKIAHDQFQLLSRRILSCHSLQDLVVYEVESLFKSIKEQGFEHVLKEERKINDNLHWFRNYKLQEQNSDDGCKTS